MILVPLTAADQAAGITMRTIEARSRDGEPQLVMRDFDGNGVTGERLRVVPLLPSQALELAANLTVAALNAANGQDTGQPHSIAPLHF